MSEKYTPAPEETKKAEEIMSKQESKQSSNREKGYNLLGLKEKLRIEIGRPMLIERPLDAFETAQLLFDRYQSITQEINHENGAADALMHMGGSNKVLTSNRWGHSKLLGEDHEDNYGSFPSAFIHEYLNIAKDYIKNDKNLDKRNKIKAIEELGRLFDSEFEGDGKFEYEIHGHALRTYFAQIKDELKEELEKYLPEELPAEKTKS